MRNETVQAWLLGKLVHEGLDAPPTGEARNAMNEFIRAVTKDASYKYQAGGEHKPSVWVQNYPQHATLIRGALVDALDISGSSLGSLSYRPRTLREYRAAHTPNQAKCADVTSYRQAKRRAIQAGDAVPPRPNPGPAVAAHRAKRPDILAHLRRADPAPQPPQDDDGIEPPDAAGLAARLAQRSDPISQDANDAARQGTTEPRRRSRSRSRTPPLNCAAVPPTRTIPPPPQVPAPPASPADAAPGRLSPNGERESDPADPPPSAPDPPPSGPVPSPVPSPDPSLNPSSSSSPAASVQHSPAASVQHSSPVRKSPKILPPAALT